MHVANRWYMGGGLRMLKSKGFVRSTHLANAYQFELDGDSTDVGYNLAVNYSATKNMDIALTWRSRVDLKMEGTSVGYLNPPITAANYNFNNSAHVTIPTPATVNLGLNYRKGRTSYELVYERIFWSAYSTLDFEFDDAAAEAALGAARLKSWKNTTAIRLGARHKYSDRLTLMGAIVWDENPIPDNTLGFELPDSDGMAYSLGARYKISDEIDLGLAYARSDKKSRTIPAGVNLNGISGSFSGGGGHLVNMSLRYRF
jgi:long-chain fatty acid transport protein